MNTSVWPTGQMTLCGEAGNAFATAAAYLCHLLRLSLNAVSSDRPGPKPGSPPKHVTSSVDVSTGNACCDHKSAAGSRTQAVHRPCPSTCEAASQASSRDPGHDGLNLHEMGLAEAMLGGQRLTKAACEHAYRSVQHHLRSQMLGSSRRPSHAPASTHGDGMPTSSQQFRGQTQSQQQVPEPDGGVQHLPLDSFPAAGPALNHDGRAARDITSSSITGQQHQQQQLSSSLHSDSLDTVASEAASISGRPAIQGRDSPDSQLTPAMLSKAVAMATAKAQCLLQVSEDPSHAKRSLLKYMTLRLKV